MSISVPLYLRLAIISHLKVMHISTLINWCFQAKWPFSAYQPMLIPVNVYHWKSQKLELRALLISVKTTWCFLFSWPLGAYDHLVLMGDNYFKVRVPSLQWGTSKLAFLVLQAFRSIFIKNWRGISILPTL